jgi:hypothetical protein
MESNNPFLKIRKYIENNFEYVGKNFSKKVIIKRNTKIKKISMKKLFPRMIPIS